MIRSRNLNCPRFSFTVIGRTGLWIPSRHWNLARNTDMTKLFSPRVFNRIFLMIIIQTYSIYQPLCHHGEWVVSVYHVTSKLLVVDFTIHGVLVYAISHEMITHILTWHRPWNRGHRRKNSKNHYYLPLHNCKLSLNKRSKIMFFAIWRETFFCIFRVFIRGSFWNKWRIRS